MISAKPDLAQRISREILKVEKAKFEMHGEPSPACRNIVLGQAIETFDKVFDKIRNQMAVLRFVKRQLNNPRRPVARKAKALLAKHGHTS